MRLIMFQKARPRSLACLASCSSRGPGMFPPTSVVACAWWFGWEAPFGGRRLYSPSAIVLEETAEVVAKSKRAAQAFNNRRAVYKKQVSQLRKQYAEEMASQRAADAAEKEAKRQEETRQKLERQRLKNVRSAQSAIRQREIRQKREKEFQKELRIAQGNRIARRARFAKARQLVVDELEAEAHLWLTNPEEVEKAFTPETEQLLWARPNSVLGAPAPNEDAGFWCYETHTWHMDKTYPTQREVLLEELQDAAYEEANVDRSFWTPELLAKREELEEKAKLRAMVRDEGRRVLLQKQKELLQDDFSKNKIDIPKAMPVPNVQILANTEAMEDEGAQVLLNDPTKFFEFEPSTKITSDEDSEDSKDQGKSSSYQGPTLGVPVGLKDPIRYAYYQNRPYPTVIGRMPKPDLRTEKEKKREEREQAMWAAAQGGAASDQQEADIAFEAEDTIDTGGETLDYDTFAQQYDSDDEAWMDGLDPEEDADLINLPRSERYSEEDVDWVIEKLENKVLRLKEQLRLELETAQQEVGAKRESEAGERKLHGEDLELEDAIHREVTAKSEGVDESGQPFVQYQLDDGEGTVDLRSLGVDVDEAETVLGSLTEEQMLALHTLDDLETQTMTSDEIKDALKKVPGLSEEQISSILKLEQSLAQNDELKQVLKMDEAVKDDK